MLKGKADPSLAGGADGKSAKQAAMLFGVSTASVERAVKVVEKGGPQLVALVEAGELKIKPAAQLCARPDKLDEFLRIGSAEGRKQFRRKVWCDDEAQRMKDDRQQDFGGASGGEIVRRDATDPWNGALKERRCARVLWEIPEEDLDLASAVFKRIHEEYGWRFRFLFDPFYRHTDPAVAPAPQLEGVEH